LHSLCGPHSTADGSRPALGAQSSGLQHSALALSFQADSPRNANDQGTTPSGWRTDSPAPSLKRESPAADSLAAAAQSSVDRLLSLTSSLFEESQNAPAWVPVKRIARAALSMSSCRIPLGEACSKGPLSSQPNYRIRRCSGARCDLILLMGVVSVARPADPQPYRVELCTNRH
jgi:hypothetical protein